MSPTAARWNQIGVPTTRRRRPTAPRTVSTTAQGQSLGPDDVVSLADRPVIPEGPDHRGGHVAGVDGLEERVPRPTTGKTARTGSS